MNNPNSSQSAYYDGESPITADGFESVFFTSDFSKQEDFEAMVWSRLEAGEYATFDEGMSEELSLLGTQLAVGGASEAELAQFELYRQGFESPVPQEEI